MRDAVWIILISAWACSWCVVFYVVIWLNKGATRNDVALMLVLGWFIAPILMLCGAMAWIEEQTKDKFLPGERRLIAWLKKPLRKPHPKIP